MRNRDELRPGQVKAVDHIYERDEGIFVLDCGGGKTATLLTVLIDWFDEGVISRAIVAAPPTVAREVWPAEPAKWSYMGHLRVIDGTGTPKQRQRAYADWASSTGAVLVVTIPNIATIEKELRAVDLSEVALLIDEVSMLKAPTGVLAKAAERLSARCAICWGATGTPRPGGWEDLFRPIRVVSRGKVWGGKGGFDGWRAERFMPLDRNGYNWRVHTFAEKEMEKDIAPLMYRAQDDPIAGLLELRSGVEFDRVIDLPDDARAAYKKMEKELLARVVADLKGATTEEVVLALSKATASMKLEQIAQGYLYDEGEAAASLHSRKVEALQSLLEEVGGENVIITYRFRHDLAVMRAALGDFPALGGEVSPKVKSDLIHQWNDGKLPILGLHPASAGHGVELQRGGRRVIWFNPTWSAEQAYQTDKRVHRSGQDKVCYSHRIIARDTVDELKRLRCEGNLAAQAEYIARIAQG